MFSKWTLDSKRNNQIWWLSLERKNKSSEDWFDWQVLILKKHQLWALDEVKHMSWWRQSKQQACSAGVGRIFLLSMPTEPCRPDNWGSQNNSQNLNFQCNFLRNKYRSTGKWLVQSLQTEFFWGLQLTEVKKINGEKFLMGGRLSKVNNFSHAY